MPTAQEMRDSSGNVLEGRFVRVATEGDAARFIAAEPGKEVIIHIDSRSATVSSGPPLIHEYTLPFHYQMGAKQLEVHLVTDHGQLIPVTRLGTVNAARDNTDPVWPISADLDPDAATTDWKGWAEVASNKIHVYNSPKTATYFGVPLVAIQARIPHTSTPGSVRQKLTVENQANNEAVELLGANDGIILTSPSNTRWLVRIGENGNLITERR